MQERGLVPELLELRNEMTEVFLKIFFLKSSTQEFITIGISLSRWEKFLSV
jgi:hypothetical protein